MDGLRLDLLHAVRALARRPGFSLAVVLTLALGIGANATIYALVDALMLRPLPVAHGDRLVSVTAQTSGLMPFYATYPDVQELRGAPVFDGVAAHIPGETRLVHGRDVERILVEVATSDVFDVLGVPITRGRTFGSLSGGGLEVVLTDAFWQRRFGADPGILGRELQIGTGTFTVVGVLPPSFKSASPLVPDVWVDTRGIDAVMRGGAALLQERSAPGSFSIVARRAPGVSVDAARAAVATVGERLAAAYPKEWSGRRLLVQPEPRTRLEPGAPAFLPAIATAFAALATLLLLIACANAGNLFLTRAQGRGREMAVRAALGAGRTRLAWNVISESVLLAGAGGLLGLGFAWAAARGIGALPLPSHLPIDFDVRIEPRVVLVAAVLTFLAALLSAAAPAVRAGLQPLRSVLAEDTRSGVGRARHLLRDAAVVLQVAASLVLLVCAGLFLRSLANVGDWDPGFARANRVVVRLDADLAGHDAARQEQVFREVLGRVRRLPGVSSATFARHVPIDLEGTLAGVFVEGDTSGVPAPARANAVESDYFRHMGIPVLAGRPIGEQDVTGAPSVMVVNEAFAEKFWPGQPAVGRRVRLDSAEASPVEVVGVVRNSTLNLPGETPRPGLYLALRQVGGGRRVLQVESTQAGLIPLLRAEIRAIDPDLPVLGATTMEDHLRHGKGSLVAALGSGISGVFGAIGVVLAAIGLGAVVAFTVAERTREIGLRLAVGAEPAQLVRMIVGRGLRVWAVGAGVGAVVALLLARAISGLLVGVGPGDPVTWTGVVALLLAVAALASWLPARRAARLDPLEALRAT